MKIVIGDGDNGRRFEANQHNERWVVVVGLMQMGRFHEWGSLNLNDGDFQAWLGAAREEYPRIHHIGGA